MLLALVFALVVSLPTLGVEAQTEALSVVGGQLGAPVNPDAIGTYQLEGNLLLVGHVDGGGRLRAFAGLRRLEEGAPIVLSDGRVYHVSWMSTWSVDEAETWQELAQPGGDVLTLITCTGAWSRSRGEYLQRLVVRASRD